MKNNEDVVRDYRTHWSLWSNIYVFGDQKNKRQNENIVEIIFEEIIIKVINRFKICINQAE